MADAIRHMNPFRDTALKYRKAGWLGTIYLPYKKKYPPPTGYIGHRAKYPTLEKVEEWRSNSVRQNIGIRLAGVDKEHEIIGIDVDHYQSGDKDKRGGDQLKNLESRFGSLPDTWISSSRTDGFSGIRYYRVPRGLAFRGKIDKDIECISKGIRFAAVWPSVHPSGETYWWFPPGTMPSDQGRSMWGRDGNTELPVASLLPLLPESWLEYLTQGKMRSEQDDRIDMDSQEEEIWEWCDATLHGDDDTEMCSLMSKKVAGHIKKIKDEATSHDKIVNAHYNIARLAVEGHLGYVKAISEVQGVWAEEVLKRDKRSIEELRSEAYRSRINAFRKIKAQSDEQVKVGARAVLPRCDEPSGVCYTGINSNLSDDNGDQPPPDDPLSDIPRGPIKPVDEYLMNDDGNAAHLVDMFSSLEIGPAFRHAEGLGWLIWHTGKGDEQPHWQLDSNGNQEMRRMWQVVRDKQADYAENALKPAWIALQQQFIQQQQQNIPAPNGILKSDVELAKVKYREWKQFSQISGNNRNAINALEAAKSIPGVSVSINELDRNPLLLGVANGVIQLGLDDVDIRPASVDDLITLNTHVPYEPPSKLAQSTWEKYLDTFLPDLEHRRVVQIILGHCLIGGNPEKTIIILRGKSETGKSTMLSAIEAALGEYAAPVNETMFQSSHFNEVLSNAMDKRVVTCSEFDQSIKLSSSILKRLTGNDSISMAIKHSNAVKEGSIQFVAIIASNVEPDVTGVDQALKNRLKVIPFETRPDDIDRSLSNVVVKTCGTAVLWWLIEGYKQYRVLGKLPTNKLIEDKTQEFMDNLDDIALFLSEGFSKHDRFGRNIEWKYEPEWCVKRDDVHKHYKQWCEINEIPERNRLTPHALTRRLKSLGVADSGNVNVSVNGVVGKFWFGVKLRKLRRGGNIFPMRTVSEGKV